jgi:hypothetical protein
MGIFDKLLKPKPAPPVQKLNEQAVLIYINGEEFDPMIVLSDKLTAAIESALLGEFDGNEIGGGETILFMYGADAEALYQHIEPILKVDPLCRGARAIVRQGKPGSPQREILL